MPAVHADTQTRRKWCSSWFEMSSRSYTGNQQWDKTFGLPNTMVISALLDCWIMNIYCIMKMWWHLEESHLTLSSCASVSPLSTNAFCSKQCILKDSGRNVRQSRHPSRAWGVMWRGHFRQDPEFWISHKKHTLMYQPAFMFRRLTVSWAVAATSVAWTVNLIPTFYMNIYCSLHISFFSTSGKHVNK